MAGDIAWLDVWRAKGLVAGEATIPPGHSFLLPDRTIETSEKKFQAAVIAFAESRGWKCYHTHDSRRSAKGFPDLVMVRDKLIFAELKVKGGKLTQEQRDWLSCLCQAGQLAYAWNPSHWPEIEKLLA